MRGIEVEEFDNGFVFKEKIEKLNNRFLTEIVLMIEAAMVFDADDFSDVLSMVYSDAHGLKQSHVYKSYIAVIDRHIEVLEKHKKIIKSKLEKEILMTDIFLGVDDVQYRIYKGLYGYELGRGLRWLGLFGGFLLSLDLQKKVEDRFMNLFKEHGLGLYEKIKELRDL